MKDLICILFFFGVCGLGCKITHDQYKIKTDATADTTAVTVDTVDTVSVDSVVVPEKFITHVTLTVYNPTTGQCDSDPLITADLSKINLKELKAGNIKWCAVSRDLLEYFPYGSKIYIEDEGWYEVHDTMNKRFGHCIDILKHKGEPVFKKDKVQVIKYVENA